MNKINILKVLIGVISIALSAYGAFSIPISETGIPFTLQSLMVFVVAALLKPKEFILCIIIYLISGILGLPVFAEGTHGWDKIVGSSGGFLYGFLFSGLFISYALKNGSKSSIFKLLNIFVEATIVLFVFGIIHLAIKLNIDKALEYGLFPFWKMALVKALLATIIVWLIQYLYKKPIKS